MIDDCLIWQCLVGRQTILEPSSSQLIITNSFIIVIDLLYTSADSTGDDRLIMSAISSTRKILRGNGTGVNHYHPIVKVIRNGL